MPSFKILRRAEVQSITGLSRSTIYAMIAKGEFTRPILLAARAVGWRSTDVEVWLNERVRTISAIEGLQS